MGILLEVSEGYYSGEKEFEFTWEIVGWESLYSGNETLRIFLPLGIAAELSEKMSFEEESNSILLEMAEPLGSAHLARVGERLQVLETFRALIERDGTPVLENLIVYLEPGIGMATLTESLAAFTVAQPWYARNVSVAYDQERDRFLFVWSTPTNPDCRQTPAFCYDNYYSQLVAPDGSLIGGQNLIVQNFGYASQSRLAFSSGSDSFIAVVSDNDIVWSSTHLNIIPLDVSGAVSGTGSVIEDKRLGDLVYSSSTNEFLLSWNGQSCYSSGVTRVRPNGTQAGYASFTGVFDIAYNVTANELLVAHAQCGMGNVYVTRLNPANLATLGGPLLVPDVLTPSGGSTSAYVRLAHDVLTNEYLISWTEDLNLSGSMYYDNFRIWARRLLPSGSVVPGAVPFEVTVTDPACPRNRLAASSEGGLYMAVWQFEGQLFGGDGALVEDEVMIMPSQGLPGQDCYAAQGDGGYKSGPFVIAAGGANRFVVAWTEAAVGGWAVKGMLIAPSPNAVPDDALLTCEQTKAGGVDGRSCDSTYGEATGEAGDPIDTRTGGFSYAIGDIDIPTSAGALVFQRSYASTATSTLTGLLGYGWTHNHDTRLIFPGDPGGKAGSVLFKAIGGNQYEFADNGDGTYSAVPGVLLTLIRNDGPPITFTVTHPGQAAYAFNESGRILSWSDAQGHAWAYSYDGSNRLDRVTDDTGQRFLDFSYDAQNRIQAVADHTGRDVTFGYDAAGDLTTVTDVQDEPWSYFYDAEHRLRIVRDPDNQQIARTEYDLEGRAYQQYDGSDQLVLEITYGPEGTVFTDALENDTTHAYDQRNTLIETQNDSGVGASRSYDGNFRPEAITDENDNTVQLTWSDDGANLQTVIDAEENSITLDYDALNNLTTVTDARDKVTTYDYNETDPDPTRRTLLLGVDGPLPGTDDTTTYTYTTAADAPQPVGLLKTITDANGKVTHFVYDQFGQRTETTDPLSHTTEYDYDSLGRLETTTDPLNWANWTCYDAAGRVVRSVANATGDGSSPQEDPCDVDNYQPSSDPDKDRITTSVYDDHGNLIATTGPDGTTTRTYYDANNRPVTVVQNLAGGIFEDPPDRGSVEHNIRTDTTYDDQGNVIATEDNAGTVTRTFYDNLNRPVLVVQNLTGQDIEVTATPVYNPGSPDQNVRTETVYDNVGNVIAVIDTLGMKTRTYYDKNNRPETVVQNLSVGIGDPAPNRGEGDENIRTDTAYDGNGNVIATTDPKGVVTRTYFDEANRATCVVVNQVGQPPENCVTVDPTVNIATRYYYDDVGRQIAVTDPRGVTTRTYYDDAGRPETVVQNLTAWDISNPDAPSRGTNPEENLRTDTIYDDGGQAIATKGPDSVTTRTYYDGLGRVWFVVRNLTGWPVGNNTPPAYNPAYPDQNVGTETVYDSKGDAIATIDNAGIITRTYYDDLHRAVAVVQNLTGPGIWVEDPPEHNPSFPDQNVVTLTEYGPSGEIVESSDELGHLTVSCYDDLGREVKHIQNPSVGSPCGNYTRSAETDQDLITTTVYDGLGNRKQVTDPNDLSTSFDYDGVYRLVIEDPPVVPTTSYTYDASGNQVAMTDAEGVVTKYEYDALSRLTAVVENYLNGVTPDHQTNVRTEYTYDAAGNRLTIVDANTHPTATFTYDDLGRLKTEKDALDHTTTYFYDMTGNRASVLDAESATTYYQYDDLGRLTAIDYPSPDADVSFTYDAAGDRVSMTDGVGGTSWVYDDLHRATSVTGPFAGAVGYTYDAAGNRKSLSYPNISPPVQYAYDLANRLEQVIDWDLLPTAYTYDRGGRPDETTLPNGVVTQHAFDDANRLLSLTHTKGAATLASYTYTYDDVGNRLTASESLLQPVAAPSLLWVADTSNNRNLLFDVASVADGENAVDLLGEYDASGAPLYIKNGVNDGPNVRGFNVPNETAIDATNHRLFVSDTSNNRVLVFNLDASNQFVDRVADNVLGQPNLTSSTASLTASGMSAPRGLALQASTNRLFVVDTGYHRVLVFDVAAVTNGEAAINVLGQANFTSGSSSVAQNRLSGPQGAALVGNLLYVGDSTNNRIMVFDIASITNGENAVDLLGEYDAAGSPLYTKNGANDGPNVRGFNAPYDSVVDAANHRLFVSDTTNNRVLVFNLDASNQLVDRVADYVLGQSSMTSSAATLTASGMSAPRGLALQSSTNRLFVVDTSYHRVLVFDVAAITNGEPAINVLGQATFTAGSSGLAQNRLSSPRGAALNGNLLFVGDTTNNRVLVFDVAAITNGENAVNVLGQATFTTSTAATSQTGLSSPRGVVVDTSNRLFVADTTNNRVMVFDVAAITDGEAAVSVLGQATFTTSTAATTSTGLRAPEEVIAEASTRLFVGDTSNHRLMVFDVAAITNGEAAVNVLGQTTFTVGTAGTTQGRLSSPVGVFLQSNLLYAADGGNHRLMVFDVAAITDGENAVNLAGQVDGSLSPVYTKAGVHDGPNAQGFALSGTLSDLAVDLTGHRLFASDPVNNRVLVFNLDANNLLIDRVPDAVLGQTSFYSSTAAVTQSQFSSPRGLAFDPSGNRLFVADYTNNRVMVFDVASITNGENAVNVLGQATFTTSTAATTQAGLYNPAGVTFEQGTNQLWVADANNHRLTVFDVASITNGEAAVNAAGQLDASLAPAYTKNGLHDGPNPKGLNLSGAFASQAIDTAGHRLFASDPTNHRVLVFNLTTDNLLIDHTPDAVLGQADFTSRAAAAAQNRFNSPRGLAYDPAGNCLFVVDYSNSRVMVFDVASITNGENAVNVLGQATFTASSGATAQNRLRNPVGASLDALRGWLFVGDYANHRVMVFDVNSITNGENAFAVLGQATFTTSTSATSQTGLKNPSGLVIEQATGRLFVADMNNHRVMVFDAAAITNGEPAINVLGQATFTTATSATTQSGMKNPQGVALDTSASRLFVADTNNHRVTIFDAASITNGENAVNVLGQLNFTSGASATTQGRMYAPMGVLVAPSISSTTTNIAYDYDPLYRLTEANYNGGPVEFVYTYDAVGNLTRETTQAGYTDYVYDDANRMTSAGGVPLTWSDNGNLLADGTSSYQWNHANRLVSVSQGSNSYVLLYTGLGDRVRQTVNGVPTSYTLDLEGGLTQVLADGTNAYLYGNGRLAEEQPGGWAYHLPDALGSVRQLTDAAGALTLAHAFEPYGESLASSGAGDSAYGYTGEWTDSTGLVHLRARYYAPYLNRFTSRDVWGGDPKQPISYNGWAYAYASPENLRDPSGHCPDLDGNGKCDPGWHCSFISSPELRKICQGGCGLKACPSTQRVPMTWGLNLGSLFVELVRECPGWWQDDARFNTGHEHDVRRLALAFELQWEAHNWIWQGAHFQALSEALAHKYWTMSLDDRGEEVGILMTTGGSASVYKRVKQHYDNEPTFDRNPDTAMSEQFLEALHAVDTGVFGRYSNQPGHENKTRPYEWGNPPVRIPQVLEPKPWKQGLCPGRVFSISDSHDKVRSGDQCVLTYDQFKCIGRASDGAWNQCRMDCEAYEQAYLR